MINVIGVRFRNAGKIYYFNPGELDIKLNSHVIVETTRGIEYGEVVMLSREIDENDIINPLKSVIRIATKEDDIKVEKNNEKEKEAFDICLNKIENHNLDMKLIDVEYTFDNNKILFYFTADGRIDFRELVKDLAAVFKTRIELRQIGVRDETKMKGGIGICGKKLCCHSFITEFQPVSIKMAKEQSLSLNPSKISGVCGRLMCCLKYEQDVYEDIIKKTPKAGAIVETPEGQGTVVDVNVLREKIKVRLDKENETDLKSFDLSNIKIIEDVACEEETDEDLDILKGLED